MASDEAEVPSAEVPFVVTPDADAPAGASLWESAPSSACGSFRADEAEESALCCSLSMSEDALSEYSDNHYGGSEAGSRKSGRAGPGSAGISPCASAVSTSRSGSGPQTRSVPSSVYLSSSVAGGAPTPLDSGASSVLQADVQSVSSHTVLSSSENGGVSPKRRGQGRGGGRAKKAGGGGGADQSALRGGWMGKPGGGGDSRSRGAVGFQSCLRPGLGSVRTIMEEDEEGLEESDEEEEAEGAEPASVLPRIERIRSQSAMREAERSMDPALEPIRTSSTKSQTLELSSAKLIAARGGGQKAGGPGSTRRPGLEQRSCLCPGTLDAPTEASSSAAESPPGSPDRLSMSVYFCGLPGTGAGKRRGSCGFCGRQVGRRAPQCRLCRVVVYCDQSCREMHEKAHLRSCPGAAAQRLRTAVAAPVGLVLEEDTESDEGTPRRKAPARPAGSESKTGTARRRLKDVDLNEDEPKTKAKAGDEEVQALKRKPKEGEALRGRKERVWAKADGPGHADLNGKTKEKSGAAVGERDKVSVSGEEGAQGVSGAAHLPAGVAEASGASAAVPAALQTGPAVAATVEPAIERPLGAQQGLTKAADAVGTGQGSIGKPGTESAVAGAGVGPTRKARSGAETLSEEGNQGGERSRGRGARGAKENHKASDGKLPLAGATKPSFETNGKIGAAYSTPQTPSPVHTPSPPLLTPA